MSNQLKRRRKFISLEEKIEILNRLRGGERPTSVGRALNLSEGTIRSIKKNELRIRQSVADGYSLSNKRAGRARNLDIIKVEHELMLWYEDCVEKKIPVNSVLMRHKALRIYQALKGIDSRDTDTDAFRASKGWFEKLKKRYSLRSSDLKGTMTVIEDEPLPEERPTNVIDLEIGLAKAKELEMYFLRIDPSAGRAGRFRIDFHKCLAPYKELLSNLQSEQSDTAKMERKHLVCSEDEELIHPVFIKFETIEADAEETELHTITVS